MELQAIIGRATTEPAFAEELKRQATAARDAGPGSEAWDKLMEHFASNPEELTQMKASNETFGWTTLTTVTTPECTTTTATTGH